MDPRYESQARFRPPYPKLQTPSNDPAVVSSFQSSSSSLASLSSSSSKMSPSSRQTAAPLPSPSDSQQQQQLPLQYFASFHSQACQQQGGVYIQQQVQSQTQQQFGGGRVEGYNCQPDRAGAGTTEHEIARYMSEYGLVAEAAKRAEMAVLMRDLGGLDLR